MKAIILASLLLATASNLALGQVNSPDPECEYCNDASFLFAAQDALNDCPGQLRILQSRLDSATTDQNIDMAWNYFCTGSCYTNIQKIDDDHTCCMGEYGPMAMNIRHGCSRSATGRYCGAEVSNLKKVDCSGPTDSETCTAKTNCQWDSEAKACYFNADAATIDGICSDCNRKYFNNFFGGGIYTPQEHAMYAGKYATFCTPLNGTSCYAVSAGVGFRQADALGSTDVSNRICATTPVARRAKMCMRSNSARVGEAFRRAAAATWETCTGDDCDAQLNTGYNRAAAIDASARHVCVQDDGGALCAAKIASSFSTVAGGCMERTLHSGSSACEGTCPTTSWNAISSFGCCAATYGFNGFVEANTTLGTVALSQFDLGLAHYNLTAEGSRLPSAGSRVAHSDAAYKSLNDAAKSYISTNDGLKPVRTCGNVDGTAPSTQCYAGGASRQYEFELALRYDVVANSKYTNYLYHAFAVDVASAIGVAATQISSVSAKSSTLTVRINAVNYAATILVVTVEGDSDADNQACDDAIAALNMNKGMFFPVFGPEVALNLPTSYRYGYNSFFNGAYAVEKAGDSPLSTAGASNNDNRPTGNGGDVKGPQANTAFAVTSTLCAVAGACALVLFTSMAMF